MTDTAADGRREKALCTSDVLPVTVDRGYVQERSRSFFDEFAKSAYGDPNKQRQSETGTINTQNQGHENPQCASYTRIDNSESQMAHIHHVMMQTPMKEKALFT
jgi:hypothetical protein